jgi:hypothetical protein
MRFHVRFIEFQPDPISFQPHGQALFPSIHLGSDSLNEISMRCQYVTSHTKKGEEVDNSHTYQSDAISHEKVLTDALIKARVFDHD